MIVSETLIIALVASIISPMMLALVTAWVQHRKTRADWEREDEKERKALEREKLLRENSNKLDSIHSLVNGNLSKALRGRYDSTLRELASLEDLVVLKHKLGMEPTAQTMLAIRVAKDSLTDLDQQIKELNK